MARIPKRCLTRLEIIRVASRTFLEDGYAATTVSAMAKELEISPGNQILLNSENYLQYTSQEGIQWVIDVHEDIISAGSTSGKGSRRTITICYQMTDGRQISRHYTIYEGTKAWDALQRLYNSPEVLLGYEDRESFFKAVSDVCIDGYSVAELCDTYERKYGKAYLSFFKRG